MDPTGKGDQPDQPEGAKEWNESYANKADEVIPEQPWKTSR